LPFCSAFAAIAIIFTSAYNAFFARIHRHREPEGEEK
jgi:hypothetical protein